MQKIYHDSLPMRKTEYAIPNTARGLNSGTDKLDNARKCNVQTL
jgi:hypothetical protein